MLCRIATITILLLSVQLIPIWALRCYQCNGGPGTSCYDKFNPSDSSVPTVESMTGWCVKAKGEAFGIKAIDRDAQTDQTSPKCTKTGCIKVSIPIIGDQLQCCCNTDLCNSSGRLSQTMAMGVIFSLFALTFKKLMF